jgi:dephospho-CoA kinase
MHRNNISEAEIRQRMDLQFSNSEKSQKADFVINNAGSEMVIPQVLAIIHSLQE